MRYFSLLVVLLLISWSVSAQLVRRRDYDAAFALQVGGEAGMLLPGASPKLNVRPVGGLKMTFPFSRKWFMGGEINYSELKSGNNFNWIDQQIGVDDGIRYYSGGVKTDFFVQRIQIPIYLKYMLNSNRASVLFGVYGAVNLNNRFDVDARNDLYSYSPGLPDSHELTPPGFLKNFDDDVDSWGGGLVVGIEQQLARHFYMTFKITGEVKQLLKQKNGFNKKMFPLQASLTLSLDVLRIGDCGCS